jgi:hypothetical protein
MKKVKFEIESFSGTLITSFQTFAENDGKSFIQRLAMNRALSHIKKMGKLENIKSIKILF